MQAASRKILDAVITVIREWGFNATLQEITENAGVCHHVVRVPTPRPIEGH